jgi:small-conductance mechanosensitive channel
MVFGVTYQTPPETLEQVPAVLRDITDAVPLASFDRAHMIQFGASSIDFEFVFHVEASDIVDFNAARQAIMIEMMKRFREMDVEFAYPTQVTYTAAPDGKLVMPYPHVKVVAVPEDDGKPA